MLRIVRLSIIGAILSAVWLLTLAVSPLEWHSAVAWTPVALVLAFGCYLLASLIRGVLTFRTVPEESEYLKQDIVRARAALSQLGVSSS